MWTIPVLLVASCFIASANGGPTEKFGPQVTWTPGPMVKEGDTVLLQCQVGLEHDAPAIWLKLDPLSSNNDEIISHGDLVIMEDPRLHVHHQTDTNTFVLAIRGISTRDAGRYQCRVPVSSEATELRAAPPVTISFASDAGGGPANSSPPPTLPRRCNVAQTCCLSLATYTALLLLLINR